MKKRTVFTILFLVAQAILYWLIMTSGGLLLIHSQYIAIILCFMFAAMTCTKSTALILMGLAFT